LLEKQEAPKEIVHQTLRYFLPFDFKSGEVVESSEHCYVWTNLVCLDIYANIIVHQTCDNVLLEHRLALELKEHGLLERIYPVSVIHLGDENGRAS